jgi:hypothetical protein
VGVRGAGESLESERSSGVSPVEIQASVRQAPLGGRSSSDVTPRAGGSWRSCTLAGPCAQSTARGQLQGAFSECAIILWEGATTRRPFHRHARLR